MKGLRHIARRLFRPLPEIGRTPFDVVHHEGPWRLVRYRARPTGLAHRTPILLVPSLINRYHVLDLMPGKSLVEYLVAEGHDVTMIDWGAPRPEDRSLTFDEFCDGYLGRAVRLAAKHARASDVHLAGYCMGGTLTAIYAAAAPASIRTLTELAAPVRFSDEGILNRWMNGPGFDVGALVDGWGNIPWPLMQVSFHMLRPTLNLSKLVHLLDREWDDESLDGFLALERWGNTNVSFPGECYRTYIERLYQQDALFRGTFRLRGRAAKLENIRCPTMVVTFEHDNIVPHASAAALLEKIPTVLGERLHLPGGHVGALVAKSARERLWRPLANFWAHHDVQKSKGRRRKVSGDREPRMQ